MGLTISNSFGNDDLHRSHKLLDRLDKIADDAVRHFAKNFLLQDNIPDFQDIQIETCNRCNNDCPFCPANRNFDTRKPMMMDEHLFYSIIDQLRFMDYRGTISLFANNEPLLDGRILKFIEYARKKLPDATHYLYTNGILLTAEKFSSLTKNLHILVIDNYDDNFELIPSVKKTLEAAPPQYDLKSATFKKDLGSFIPASRSECDVRIDMRKKNQVLEMQAGTSPNRINEENKFRAKSGCVYPFKQMIVRPDGTTAKCCNDPLTDVITGDLNTQTLAQVWRGKAYQEFRRTMYFDGRQSFKGCTFCDTFGLANYIPSPQANQNEINRLIDECRLRKKLGKIYIFDTSDDSMGLFDIFNGWGVKFDGLVNFKDDPPNQYYKFVDLDEVLAEHAFMMIPTPFYPDKLSDFLDEVGYQYERDYLFFNHGINL